MINLTDSALNAVRSAMAGAAEPVGGLRIKVESGRLCRQQIFDGPRQ